MSNETDDNEVRRFYVERRIVTQGGRFAKFYRDLLDEGRIDLIDAKGEFRPIFEIKGKPPVLHPLPQAAYEMYEKAHAVEKTPASKLRDPKEVIATIRQQLGELPKDDLRRKIFPGLLLITISDLQRTGAWNTEEFEEQGAAYLLDEHGKLKDIELLGELGITPLSIEGIIRKSDALEKAHAYKSGTELLAELRAKNEMVEESSYRSYGSDNYEWGSLLPDKIKREYINAIATSDPENPRLAEVVQELVDRQTDPDKFKGEKRRTKIIKERGDWLGSYDHEETVDPVASGLGYIGKALDLPHTYTPRDKRSRNRYHEDEPREERGFSYTKTPAMHVLKEIIRSLDKPFEVERPPAPKTEIVEAPTLEGKLAKPLTLEEQKKADAIKDTLTPGWREREAMRTSSELGNRVHR